MTEDDFKILESAYHRHLDTIDAMTAQLTRMQKLYAAAWDELVSARLVLESKGSRVIDRRGPADVFRTLPVFESHFDRWKKSRDSHDAIRKEAGL